MRMDVRIAWKHDDHDDSDNNDDDDRRIVPIVLQCIQPLRFPSSSFPIWVQKMYENTWCSGVYVCVHVCLASVPRWTLKMMMFWGDRPKSRNERQEVKYIMYNILSNFLAVLIIDECDAYWLFEKWTREISRVTELSRRTRRFFGISRPVCPVQLRETIVKLQNVSSSNAVYIYSLFRYKLHRIFSNWENICTVIETRVTSWGSGSETSIDFVPDLTNLEKYYGFGLIYSNLVQNGLALF